MPTTRAVFDSSVVLRAALTRSADAVGWLRLLAGREVRVHVPELLFAEVAHVLRRHVAAQVLSTPSARTIISGFGQLPVRVHSLRPLAEPALERALAGCLSGYDAFYVVLAEATDAVLVTADRRLVEAYDRVELLT